MEYGLIANRLGHSFSADIHARIGGYLYELHELPEAELDAFLRARDFKGINVTIPYKSAVIPYLDEIDRRAASIGAVNTVVNRQNRLCGYNTDYDGLRALILRTGGVVRGQKALILGSGGTAKTARAVLSDLGASEIFFVRRDKKDGAIDYEEVYARHADASVLVNTTPCGMYPDNGGLPTDGRGRPVDLDAFPRLLCVIDVIFNPLRTALVLGARDRGLTASGGLYMLVSQAVHAAQHFFDRTFDEGLTDRVYREILTDKSNTVLIGMPGSGKSTLGKAAAERLGREFVDLDERITGETGRTPAQIIARDGEEAFRQIEARLISELSKRTGIVIATGGGCVTRGENIAALRENGVICHIDRPLPLLRATDDRPLSNTEDKLKALYERRAPLYAGCADYTVKNDRSPEEALEALISGFREHCDE